MASSGAPRTSRVRIINRLSIRITLLFLLVMLPVIAFSMLFYWYSYTSGLEQTMKALRQRQQYIAQMAEDELTRVYSEQTELTLNADISYMILRKGTVSDYTWITLMRNVLTHLRTLKNSNRWIEDVRLHVPGIRRTLTGEGEVRALDAEYQLLSGGDPSFVSYHFDGSRFTITSRYPWMGDNVQYLMVAEISREQIQRFFRAQYTDSFESAYLYDPELRWAAGTDDAPPPALSSVPHGQGRLSREGRAYISLTTPVLFGQLRMTSLVEEPAIFRGLALYRTGVLIAMAIALLLAAVFIFMIMRWVNRPAEVLMSAFAQMQKGRLDIRLTYSGRDEFAVLYQDFDDTLGLLRRLIDENYKQRILVQQMELKQLHAQVNPHFLHNSFLNLYSMAQMQDFEGIQEFAMKLSQYYRYITRTHCETVALSEEFAFVKAYADIQSIRFEGRVSVLIDPVPESIASARIPKFILQTLVENAFKYALPSIQGEGRIHIGVLEGAEEFEISVEDNGTAFSEEKLGEIHEMLAGEDAPDSGTGLFNVRMRIRLHYGAGSRMRVCRAQSGGMRVELSLPKHHQPGE